MVSLPLAGRNTEASTHDSTYNILKSLSPGRNIANLPSAADAAIICTSAILQQTKNKSANEIEKTDNLVSKVGRMCDTVQTVKEQTQDAESPPVTPNFIKDVNNIIDRTNNDSTNQWNVKESITKLVTDNNASQDKILSAHSKGDVTSDQLIQKMREQLDKAKSATSSGPDSIAKQLGQLGRDRQQNDSTFNNIMKEVHGMMSRFSIKPSAEPQQTVSQANTAQSTSSGGGTGRGGSGSDAPAESAHRSPGSKR